MVLGLTKVISLGLFPQTREPREPLAGAHDAQGAISGPMTECSKERKDTKFERVS